VIAKWSDGEAVFMLSVKKIRDISRGKGKKPMRKVRTSFA